MEEKKKKKIGCSDIQTLNHLSWKDISEPQVDRIWDVKLTSSHLPLLNFLVKKILVLTNLQEPEWTETHHKKQQIHLLLISPQLTMKCAQI